MLPSILQGAAPLASGVSMVFILQAGDQARVSTQDRYYFECILLLQIDTRIQCNMLSWALVSSQLVGKGQTLTYIKS